MKHALLRDEAGGLTNESDLADGEHSVDLDRTLSGSTKNAVRNARGAAHRQLPISQMSKPKIRFLELDGPVQGRE